jgi:hypothetical protein
MAAVANKRWAWFFGRRLILFFQNFKVFAQWFRESVSLLDSWAFGLHVDVIQYIKR